jgi:hypothetical protein
LALAIVRLEETDRPGVYFEKGLRTRYDRMTAQPITGRCLYVKDKSMSGNFQGKLNPCDNHRSLSGLFKLFLTVRE